MDFNLFHQTDLPEYFLAEEVLPPDNNLASASYLVNPNILTDKNIPCETTHSKCNGPIVVDQHEDAVANEFEHLIESPMSSQVS